MIHNLQIIILHSIKYTDNSIIVYAYTNKFGRQTYIINGSRKSGSRSKITLFQPLFLLDVMAYKKPNASMQRLKEFRLLEPLQSIPFEMKKTSIAMFIAEVVYKIIREEEPNEALFNFILNSVLMLDKMEEGTENFHLHFLANLSKFIGFHPNGTTHNMSGYFDIKKGRVVDAIPNDSLFFDIENTKILQTLLQMPVSDIAKLSLNRTQRHLFLNNILSFYDFHFDKLTPINSLKVFTELFN